MTNEFFPPTETELEEMIFILKKKLENEKYSDEWEELAEELEKREEQLQQLILLNNIL